MLLWLTAAPALAQVPGALSLTPAQPAAGQPVTLRYHAAGTVLTGKPVGEFKVLRWQGSNRPPAIEKLTPTLSGDDWQATYQLPAGTKAFVVTPTVGEVSDTNEGKGYVFAVYAGQQPVAGALGSEAMIYSRGLGVQPEPMRALALLRQEMAKYPASKPEYSYTYYSLLAASKLAADRAELKKELLRLRRSPREEDRITAINLYSDLKQDRTADSLLTATKKAFPKGSLMRNTYLDTEYGEKDPAKQLALYEGLLQKFPEVQAAPDDRIVYDYARHNLAMTYAEAGNTAQALKYVYLVKEKDYQATAYSSLASVFLESGQVDAAQRLLKQSLDGYQANLAAKTSDNLQEDAYYNYLNLYSQVLYAQKQYPEALTAAHQAYAHSNKKDPNVMTNYALALAANQQEAAALPLLEELIKSGQASAPVKSALQPAYIKAKGSAAGYDAYLAGLQNALRANIRAGLAKQMIDKPAPDFTLRDLQGKTITLRSLKGKVVVLDFWATWCGPCKKSFPAMQLAVEKYQANPNVAFLFIDTWERMPDPQPSVAAFIRENKYPFQVLLDLKDPVTKKTAVVGSFGITGIPTKFVLDAEGHIRFQLTGFSGGDDAAVEELSLMIELAASKG